MKIFEVYFSGKDKLGFITKSIKIVADSEQDAIDQANALNSTTAIYSATESLTPSAEDK